MTTCMTKTTIHSVSLGRSLVTAYKKMYLYVLGSGFLQSYSGPAFNHFLGSHP